MDGSGLPQSAIPAPATAPGLRAAFRLLVEHLGSHVELVQLETAQELSRLGGLLGYWFALALSLQLGLMLSLGLLLAGLWQTPYRLPAIIGSTAMLLALAVFFYWQIQRLGQQSVQRFRLSGEQWQRDLALIKEVL